MDLQLSGKRIICLRRQQRDRPRGREGLPAEGARVAITRQPAEPCAGAGGARRNCLTLGGDLGDIDSIRKHFAQLEERWGGLDILVNNAAVMVRTPLLEIEPAQWDKIMNTNLRGAFFCAQAAARLMMRQGGGVIVNTSSMLQGCRSTARGFTQWRKAA